jgi:PAS domain S-box-containing protein
VIVRDQHAQTIAHGTTKTGRIIRAPILSSGLDRARIAAALDIALHTFMAAVLLRLGAVILLPELTWRWLAIIAAVYAFVVPASFVNRRGRTRLASLIVVISLWIVITATAVTAGGIESLAVNFFAVLVLTAGVLLGANASLAAAGASLITSLVMVLAGRAGWMPWHAPSYTPAMRWLSLALLIAMTFGLVHMAARTIGDALQRGRDELAERRRAEAALRIAKQRSEDLINAIDGIVWEADARTFQFTFVSAQAERLLGYSRAQWLESQTFWRDHIHPDDRDSAVAYCVASTAKAQAHEFEYRFMAADGRDVWLRDIVTVLAERGEPITLRGIMMDVTERKRADDLHKESEEQLRRNEELFRAVVEDQTEMIVRWKPDGTRTFVNRAYSQVFGKRPEDFVGSSFFPLVAEPYHDMIREKIRSLTPEQPLATAIHESLGPDGGRRWQEWTDRGIFDADGHLVELQSTGRDITERKRAEETLKATTEQLRALSARVQSAREEEGQRIAREIHDELGGALTGLQWDLQSIDKSLLTLDQRPELDRIRGRIASMAELIDSTISTVRRISSDLRPALLDDVGLMAAIQWYLQQFQARTGIRCDYDASIETADLDHDRANAVFRICQEILTNVLRHSAATHVHVRIRQDEGWLELRVSDNGRGITDEESRGEQSLGLVGMRERARLVGGDLTVNGSPGGGTRVVVRVPVTKRQPLTPALSASRGPRTA